MCQIHIPHSRTLCIHIWYRTMKKVPHLIFLNFVSPRQKIAHSLGDANIYSIITHQVLRITINVIQIYLSEVKSEMNIPSMTSIKGYSLRTHFKSLTLESSQFERRLHLPDKLRLHQQSKSKEQKIRPSNNLISKTKAMRRSPHTKRLPQIWIFMKGKTHIRLILE